MSYGTDLAASLARPGGNATGFTLHEYGIAGKWLELLKEIAPRVVPAAMDSRGSGECRRFLLTQK
jgi:putative tryptophan/tyrosine transport system substrate-binding protein